MHLHTLVQEKRSRCSTDPKFVSVTQRRKEFASKLITVSAGKLFCFVCREKLSLKVSVIKGHVQSAKHAQHKKRLTEKWSSERDVAQTFKSYEQEVHHCGETLSVDHKLSYVKVLTTFMRAGVYN